MKQRFLPLIDGLFWYEFRQNNSHGYTVKNDDLDWFVLIQARSYGEANEIAKSLGIYFDGSGDCPCCGNRWSSKDEYDDKPDSMDRYNYLGQAIKFHYKHCTYWGNGMDYAWVAHYIDGRRKRGTYPNGRLWKIDYDKGNMDIYDQMFRYED